MKPNFNNLKLYLMLGTLGLTLAACADEARLPNPPVIPEKTGIYMHKALETSEAYLSDGKFEDAKQLISDVSYRKEVPVYINVALVPLPLRESYRQAAEKGLALWNSQISDVSRFVSVKDETKAKLLVQFESLVVKDEGTSTFGQNPWQFQCSATTYPLVNTTDTIVKVDKTQPAIARVAVYVQGTKETHQPEAVTHLVAKELGSYLGLADSIKLGEIMGPDVHGDQEKAVIDKSEIDTVRAIAQVNKTLIGFADSKTKVEVLAARMEIDKTSADAGVVARGELISFSFKVKNTGNIPLEINARPNCGCTVPNYDKVIQPGKEGKLDATVNTTNFQGSIHKYIEVTSNDPKNPQVSIALTAVVLPNVRVLPESPITITLDDKNPTVQKVTLFSRGSQPLEIKSVTTSSSNVSAKYNPWQGSIDDPLANEGPKPRKGYELELTISPQQPLGRANETITVTTNDPKTPNVNILLVMEKGIVMQPQAVFMGMVDTTPVQAVERAIYLSKKAGAFHILKAETDDKNLTTRVEPVNADHDYRVIVSYKGGWTGGYVNQKLTVTTDDPAQPTIVVPIQASVRVANQPDRPEHP